MWGKKHFYYFSPAGLGPCRMNLPLFSDFFLLPVLQSQFLDTFCGPPMINALSNYASEDMLSRIDRSHIGDHFASILCD